MASDNLTAAAAGALGSVNDLLSEYVRASIGNKFKKDYMASEKELQNKYEMEQLPAKKQYEFDILGKKSELGRSDFAYETKFKTNEDIRKEQAISNISRPILSPTGEVVGYTQGKGYKLGFEPKKSATLSKQDTEKLDDAKSSLAILSQLQDKYSTSPEGAKALISKGKSFITGGKYGDVTQRVYEDALKASAAKFYRAYSGDKRLSDKDAEQRAYPLFPSTFQEKDLGISKFKNLESGVIENVRPILDRMGISVEDFISQIKSSQTGQSGETPTVLSPAKTGNSQNMKLRKATMDDF